ncbi:hypothetical protein SAMN05444392_10898 [Seinonella peptonophila]|uniref:Uncharacterized protein n=1 Tax=Seinonella peptonophila TaxID=112248 RepID=A0A1M4Z9I3_9BACL|nr:hypothetical protein [Seinonella peptonophila]SHF14246.1 hypothetical protein SAMN05444392_10898 [Seinonella peptonophila]
MNTSKHVYDIIFKYFPRYKLFDMEEYQNSKQYQALLSLSQENLENKDIQSQLEMGIRKAFANFAYLDWTNALEYNGYEYRILLHENQPLLDDDIELIRVLGGKRRDLNVFISFLGKYYYYFISETHYEEVEDKWSFYTVECTDQIEVPLTHFNDFMKSKGYVKLTTDIVRQKVDGIETELLEEGQVEVFHCLFSEIITI